jgi:hypothetical protein
VRARGIKVPLLAHRKDPAALLAWGRLRWLTRLLAAVAGCETRRAVRLQLLGQGAHRHLVVSLSSCLSFRRPSPPGGCRGRELKGERTGREAAGARRGDGAARANVPAAPCRALLSRPRDALRRCCAPLPHTPHETRRARLGLGTQALQGLCISPRTCSFFFGHSNLKKKRLLRDLRDLVRHISVLRWDETLFIFSSSVAASAEVTTPTS